MPYLGNLPAERFTSFDKQTITGNGGTSYTLDHPVGNEQEIEVFVNNVRQEPSVAYTVAGTALTMTGNVESTDDFYVVFQGKATQTATHPETFDLKAVNGTFSGSVESDSHIISGTTSRSFTPVQITSSTSGIGELRFADTTANAGYVKYEHSTDNMILATNATERMRIAGGNVGIGTTSPARSLEVTGGTSGLVRVSGSTSGGAIECWDGTNGIYFGSDPLISGSGNSGDLAILTDTGFVQKFYVDGSERMRVTANGLTFNGDTAAANALDDYEEGTWTPSLGSTVGSGTFTAHTNNAGVYIKVGRMVYVQFNLRGTWALGTASGLALLTGLPFAVSGGGGGSRYGAGNIAYQTGFTPPANASTQGLFAIDAQTYCYLTFMYDAGAVGYFAPNQVSTSANVPNIHGSMVYYV